MKLTISRFIAALLLVIPGLGATYGFLLMKDSFFVTAENPQFPWGKFALGAILFIIGVAFIGGWTFYRDRKRNYVAPRFKKKRKPQPKSE